MALKKSQKSLKRWTKQKWRTASGKKSSETGEVYAPAATIKKLKSTAAGRKKLAAANKKKSTVNKAGNYTKPTMRKRLFEKIKAGTKGGKAGQWSARKAQMLAKEYKAKGGGYK